MAFRRLARAFRPYGSGARSIRLAPMPTCPVRFVTLDEVPLPWELIDIGLRLARRRWIVFSLEGFLTSVDEVVDIHRQFSRRTGPFYAVLADESEKVAATV